MIPISIQYPLLRGPVTLSHLMLETVVKPGDTTIDATCGNGHDTLLLANLTGPTGRVWAFDIQESALAATWNKLQQAGVEECVTLLQTGHETMREHVTVPVSAIVFNLGYLPAGNRAIITQPATTIAALNQAVELLTIGGIISITAYPGHKGGGEECRMVDAWAMSLEAKRFHSWRMGQTNVPAEAPYIILIQKAN